MKYYRTWWINGVDTYNELLSISQKYKFHEREIIGYIQDKDNNACIAEQLWAIEQGLAD